MRTLLSLVSAAGMLLSLAAIAAIFVAFQLYGPATFKFTPTPKELRDARHRVQARGADCPWAVSLDRNAHTVTCENGKTFRLD